MVRGKQRDKQRELGERRKRGGRKKEKRRKKRVEWLHSTKFLGTQLNIVFILSQNKHITYLFV